MKRLWNLARRGEGGFTLPEVLVTILTMMLVFFALHSIFDMGMRVFSFGNDRVEAVQTARIGLERMEREVRAAYPYNKGEGNDELFPDYIANPSDSITFGNDSGDGGDREIVVASEEIHYAVNGDILERNGQSVVESVEDLTFEYMTACEANGGGGCPPIASEGDIEVVRMTILVRVDEGEQELTTTVALRNRPSQYAAP